MSIVIIFPLAEELFFRDYMFHMLEAEGYPANALVFFTTLFWIGAHFHLGAWAFALIPVGVLLGLLRARSGAVIWPIIGHALYNAVLFI
ncbi:MAG: CPBP family intramembrane metalloprotease [Phyllobacteriaceae bacterium]|nr:CPBP family intramembrane metalloprotease [Phyllobacteriaceae bacterium]